ncbi:nucleoid-associated protein [Acinetobacter sp. YH12135]|uniref:nucleoid-associated protein n=2 Tax=Acinetobacter TaxID=469 RepID=UPI001C5521A5|nr:nucleoid-associated protein [Acinetobacter sp. YH12135]
MSSNIEVQALIIHRIIKLQDQKNETPPIIRPNLHPNDIKAVKLVEFLDDLLAKNGLAYSLASSFEQPTTVSKILNTYLFNKDDILPEDDESETVPETEELTRYRRISNKLTHALQYHIYQTQKTTGDHLPIIFYRRNNTNFLYIALLSLKESITIDEKTGAIIDTSSIDTQALKVAFRINLDNMQMHAQDPQKGAESKNYVSWIQKGNDEIPNYIQNYIPVMYRIDDTKSTNKLMTVLGKYLAQSEFDNIASEEIYNEVIKLLQTKAEKKEPLNIFDDIDPIIEQKAKTHNINIPNNKSFRTHRETNGYSDKDTDASNIFTPAKKALTKFENFTLSIGKFNPIKITGRQGEIGHTIDLIDNDPSAPFVKIAINPDELQKARSILKKKRPYESDSE